MQNYKIVVELKPIKKKKKTARRREQEKVTHDGQGLS
jgi:hypothetical protein